MYRITPFIALLTLLGCGGPPTSGVSSGSKFAAEFEGAPAWVRTSTCAGSSVPDPKASICGVGDHPIASRRGLSMARSAAAAKARARIARQLSVRLETMLDVFTDEYAQGVEGEQVDIGQRVREGVREVAKLPLTGATPIDSWISSSDTIYVLVALEHARALDAVKQNSRITDAMRRTLDRNADRFFDDMDSHGGGKP